METTMIILLLVGLIIIGYISLGYAPKKVLKTEVGHIYYWGIGKRILGSIRVSKDEHPPFWLSNIPFPPGFNWIHVPLEWSEVVPAGRTSEKIPGTNIDKFKNPLPIDASGKLVTAGRDELVPSLQIWEGVDYAIPIKSEDGFSVVYVLTVFYEIMDDMGPIGKPDFKLIGKLDLQSKIAPWGYGKSIDEVLSTDVEDLKTGICFEGDVQMKEFLDRKISKFGCETFSIALQIISGADVEEYLKRKQDGKKVIQEIENQGNFEKLQEGERVTKLNDAKNDAAIAAVEFTAYAEPMKDFLQIVYQGEKDIKAARSGVMFEANTETETIGAIATKEMFKKVEEASNRNVGKQRKEEEKNEA